MESNNPIARVVDELEHSFRQRGLLPRKGLRKVKPIHALERCILTRKAEKKNSIRGAFAIAATRLNQKVLGQDTKFQRGVKTAMV